MKIETQYIQKPKDTVPGQWFVECGDAFSNESLTGMLAEQGITDAESKCVGILGSDGRKHNVFRIPSRFVTLLRSAKRGDARFKFRFFKRSGNAGVIYPADFVEKPRLSKKVREVTKQLNILRKQK